MVKRQDLLIKSIDTILIRLPGFKDLYNVESQEILLEFIKVLNTMNDYKNLLTYIEDFKKKYYGREEYYKYPFLWYTIDFFKQIGNQVRLGKVNLDFILTNLRSIYKAVSKGIKLTETVPWEELQYKSNISLFSLLHENYDELTIIQSLFNLIDEKGLGIYNPSHINDAVKKGLRGHRGRISFKSLVETFLEVTDLIWILDVNFSVFDIDKIWISLRIINPDKFQKLFSISTEIPSIINSSIAWKYYKNGNESFLGYISIPKGKIEELHQYLKLLEEDGVIQLDEVKKVTNCSDNCSFINYNQGEGWKFEKSQVKNVLFHKSFVDHNNLHFNSKDWTSRWLLSNQDNPIDYIRIIRKYWSSKLFNEVMERKTQIYRHQDKTKLFSSDTAKIWELYSEGAINLFFCPLGMIKSFSLDQYVLIPPEKENEEIFSNLSKIVPLSMLYYIEDDSCRLICQLDQNLLDILKKLLPKWEFYQVISINSPYRIREKYYDAVQKNWSIPQLLTIKNSAELSLLSEKESQTP